MKHSIIVIPEAEQDILSAFSWYEEKRTGLGHDFLLNLEAGLEVIVRDPYIFPVEYKQTRKHLIKRFPYIIVYVIDKNHVIVLAVLHGRRNPDLVENRI
ncbi:MAG TPA: type II toxin-antitoxin system RelE/ParE family toxin [Spirochaetota bacterium]|nr:type II toxin-antitoxin system RelE/ParE family toxin [Spirochaetota bacterium]HQP49540.1 type II toxin-antitoxin system RelE/ParE family toxin [Spirochaetota bacterium]